MNGLVNGLVNGDENGAGRVVRCVGAGAWPVLVRWTVDVEDDARVFGADEVVFVFVFAFAFGAGLDDVAVFAFAFGAGLDDDEAVDDFFFGDALDVPC